MNLKLDQFKDVNLVIDKANDIFIPRQFVSQGDYKGRTLTVQITNNGSIGEVPGLTLNLNWHNEASGLTDLTAFTILDKTNSIFRIEYPENMMTPGKAYASIQIIQDGKVTNLKQFELIVQKLAGQPVGIAEKAEFSALVAVLADSNKFRTDIDKKADKTYINDYLSQVTVMPETFANLAEIKAKYPSGKNGLMVAADNGHKYIWANGSWTDAGVYQSQGIADLSIKNRMISDDAIDFRKIADKKIKNKRSKNIFDPNKTSSGAMTLNGAINNGNWVYTESMAVTSGDEVSFNVAYSTFAIGFDGTGKAIKDYVAEGNAPKSATITVEQGVVRLVANVYKANLGDAMITINEPMPIAYETYNPYPNKASLNWLALDDDSIDPKQLKGAELLTKSSINRFDKTKAIAGEAATMSGFIKSENWYRTDFVAVTPGDVLALSVGNQTYAVGYDSDKKPVKDYFVNEKKNNLAVITTSDINYVIINIPKDNVSSFMIAVNEQLPDIYEPYVELSTVNLPWLVDYNNQWYGKSAQMFGDSIVWYDGHAQPSGTIAVGYETWLENILGFTTVKNLGISGAPFAVGKTTDNGIGQSIETKYNPTDLALIAGGTNDFKLDVPLGEVQPVSGTFDKTTTAGALQSALEHILTTNNDQEILLMTPIQRDNSNYSIYSTNKAGFKLDDYRQMIIKLGELYSIPVWDGYAESGLNLLNLNKYTLDGLHPNNAGFERISKSLCAYIKGVF